MRITKVEKYDSIADAAGVVNYSTTKVRLFYNTTRLAASEEIRTVKNTKIQKRKKVRVEKKDDE